MEPDVAKRMMAEIPEMVAFVDYIRKEVAKLDTISDIKSGIAEEIAIEVQAKRKAIMTMISILSPLINIQDVSGSGLEDYVV